MTKFNRLTMLAVVVAAALPIYTLMANSEKSNEFQLQRNGDLYTLKADDAPLADVLAKLGQLASLDLKVDPSLNMRVSADLEDVTIEKVLAAVSQSRAMVYEHTEDDQIRLVQARLTSQQKEVASPAAVAPSGENTLALGRTSEVPPAMLTNTRRSLHELRSAEAQAILFSSAILDTKALVEEGRGLDIPEEYRADAESEVFIVQFNRTVSSADREALEALGATVSHYVPNRAYAVTVAKDQVDAVRNLPGVYVVEPYHPYYKMSHVVRERLMNSEASAEEETTPAPFKLMTFAEVDIEDDLAAAGVQVQRIDGDGSRQVMTIETDVASLKKVLKMDGVQWVEPYTPAAVMNDLGVRRLRVPSVRKSHPTLTGEGVTVAVTDTGVDFKHQGFSDVQGPTSTNFNSRISYYEFRPGPFTEGLPGDVDGHGSHVAGSILGNGALSTSVISSPGSSGPPYATNQFAGVAPRAKLVMLEDFNSIPDSEQARIGYQQGARISNNSWGNPSTFEYGTDSALWDSLVRDADSTSLGNQEYIVFFAAGNAGNGNNDGTGGTAGTVSMPGNAKNVITMGALEQPRYANNIMGVFFGTFEYFADAESDSDWQVSSFSSRGPVTATDLRVKPDLMAPGSFVASIQSYETSPDDYAVDFSTTDYRFGNVNTGTNYAYSSGTSMASPLGAGSAALIYQHLTNTLGSPPSAAMMKAILVAGARTVNSLVYKRPVWDDDLALVDDGWGLIDVNRSVNGPQIHATDSLILLDQSQNTPLQTDETYSQQISIGANEGGLRVVLAYTDRPGTPGSAIQLVNNLDLVIFGPNGAVYRGNQFDVDGVHARRFDSNDGILFDQYNNVEAITIPAGGSGTYSIRVYGRQVPEGPQDFALVIQKGIGYQGRTAGNFPSVALDTNGYPVVAYSFDPSIEGNFSNITRQINVKRWVGSYGDVSELGQWKRIEDQWYGIRDSLDIGGVSRTFENSEYPSIAVKGENIYVAWEEGIQALPQSAITNQRVFLKHFNGDNWVELGGSGQGFGVSKNTNGYDAVRPVMAVMGDGSPVVAWLQGGAAPNLSRVFLARWNGSSWVGLANSHIDGLPTAAATKIAESLSIAINSSGNPVVAFKEVTNPDGIVVLQWTGAAWGNISPADSPPFLEKPKIAAGPGNTLALAWVQTFGAAPGIYQTYQVYGARYSGGWSAVGGSQTFPGISAATNLNERPISVDVGIGFNNAITVVWQGGTNVAERTIMSRRWTFGGANWNSISGSGFAPGITKVFETYSTPDVAIDQAGLPIVAFVNTLQVTNVQEVQTYTLIEDRTAPSFLGLQSAIGGTNGNVALSWLPATDDIATSIIYRIYRGTQTFACGVTPSCNTDNVFSNLIATVTNVTSFNVTGLTPNQAYCFGVRAGTPGDLFELNTVVRSAGPVSGAGDNDGDCLNNAQEVAAGTEPCVRDTDGDGMWDGWEWTFSTNNLNKTNAISLLNTNVVFLSPIDNGTDNIRTPAVNDGTAGNLPSADIDGDGASNFEEFQWWLTFGASSCSITNLNLLVGPNPTKADTDGDGIVDGWEMINGLNPVNPADASGDIDSDGLTNLQEYQYGTDPRNVDSDGDGLNDGDEVNVHLSDPAVADSDRDGLDDGYEIAIGSNPRFADSNGNLVSDGQMVELGLSPTGIAGGYNILLLENFEVSTYQTNWVSNAPNGAFPQHFWHLSTAEPKPNTNGFVYIENHSTSRAFRAANDPSTTNVNATYTPNGGPQNLIMALNSPILTNSAAVVSNLYVSWKEYYETETVHDFMVVQVRGGSTNWIQVAPPVSGLSGVTNLGSTNLSARWITRTLDISQFAGRTNVQVRFLFTANNINNGFRGWWVDDVAIYEAASKVTGWVRDNNGRVIVGATVRALGKGGLTNYVGGHRYVLPGYVFGEVRSANDGSFTLSGLPKGNYYLKASAESFIDEFWDGPLFTPPYAFGAGLRPGVTTREEVSTNGILTLLSSGPSSNVYFELERGIGRASLGVIFPNGAGQIYPVTVDSVTNRIWNGLTSTNTAGFTNYMTVNASGLAMNFPDWLTNAVAPTYLSDLSPGIHRPYAIGTNLSLYPLAEVDLREGESTLLILTTNQASGRLLVETDDNKTYGLRINGRSITNKTPAVLNIAAGLHEITLVSSNASIILPPEFATVPLGGRAGILFASNNLSATPGNLRVLSTDVFGQSISGALVYINGVLAQTNLTIEGRSSTPVTLTSLSPGRHTISLQFNGYRGSDFRTVSVFSGVTNETTFALYQADRDYDRVGDGAEVLGYTNLFLYHRDDDPDNDGLNNLLESDIFRLFNVALNPFSADSDLDRASDGAELGFDGRTNLFAWSGLYTNAAQFGNSVQSLFVGQYLAGIDNFGSGTVTGSVAGDQFVGGLSHPLLAVPTALPALTVFTNIPSFPPEMAISRTHSVEAGVFADGHPGRVDTDADGMWDGFELAYGPSTNIAVMRLIDAGQLEEDLDADGLHNYEEFLGADQLVNTNDWTNPGAADTDGDLMPDGFEYDNGLNPLDAADAFADPDGDGLVNLGEFFSSTSPNLRDSDADFLPDYEEVAIYNSDPNNRDTDNDGLMDGMEVYDRDGDGIQDGGFFPMWAGGDLDGDGQIDGPTDWDTDGDGMPDGFEVLDNLGNARPFALNPYDPTDGDEDFDGDGLSNLQEYLVRDALFGNHPSSEPLFIAAWYGRTHDPLSGADYSTMPFSPGYPVWDYSTDPFNADTDGDGMPDGFEVLDGLHPADPIAVDVNSLLERFGPLASYGDPDGDGLWNDREYRLRFALDGTANSNAIVSLSTHPWRADTDGDGLVDGEEHHALLSSPVVQDTDTDRLMDGSQVEGYFGEVESSLRRRYALVECPSCTWEDAFLDAQTQLSPDDGVTSGHLAVIGSPGEWAQAIEAISGVGSNIAIGLFQLAPANTYFPVNGEPFNFQMFYTNLPAPAVNTTNGVVVGPDGFYRILDVVDPSVDHYLVEWSGAMVSTNHFDEALNDLWQITFPLDDGLGAPYWTRIETDPAHETPPPRWGHSMTYVPGYEIKDQNNGADPKLGVGSHILLDNRKLTVLGGRDGVDKYADVWEYWIKSNGWTRSNRSLPELAAFSFFQRNLASGISEHQTVQLMGYNNSRLCLDDLCSDQYSWNCTGIGFGEPKNRPWDNGFQRSSYDYQYILGGWNDENEYLFNEPLDSLYYKSTDDFNYIVEESRAFDNQGNTANSKDVWQAQQTETYISTNGVPTNVIPNVSAVYGDLGFGAIHLFGSEDAASNTERFSDQVPLGAYVSGTITVTNGGNRIEIVAANRATAIRIRKFPFKSPCDNIISAELIFKISTAPVGDLDLHIVGEFQADLGNAESVAYDLTPPPAMRTPIARAAGSSFVSTSLPFTIPAGVSGVYTVDVTTILQEVALQGSWRGYAVGFVMTNEVSETDFAIMEENTAFIRITHNPSYRNDAVWWKGTTVQTEQGEIPSKRKSFGMVYNHLENRIILFGGMNGVQVFDHTYEAIPPTGQSLMRWTRVLPEVSPSARWGHSMVYDDVNNRVVLFGGFDENNQALNDLWEYRTVTSEVSSGDPEDTNVVVIVSGLWREITDFQDSQRPSPRGGAMMVFFGGDFYDRGSEEYSVAGKRNKIVLFGGTDGKNYFNDMWYYDELEVNYDITTTVSNRWVLADPGGQHSPGPSPRAFGQMVYAQNALKPYAKQGIGTNNSAGATVFLFGGRRGTLPTSKDTDRDLVDDGKEYELGGPAAGRDPRINALFPDQNTTETIPFTLKRIGTWGGSLAYMVRPPIADFESLSYHERLHGWRMGDQLVGRNLPWQGYPLETTHQSQYYVIGNESVFPVEDPNTNRIVYVTGVDAFSPDWINMWYHRHAIGDPLDAKDVWQLGRPSNEILGTNGAPPYAYSGRWVYGTALNGAYSANAIMELFSPVFDLKLPNASATDTNNQNSFFLMFHEWVDLADSNDYIRVDVVRPDTPADVATRVSGLNRPTISLIPNRNNTANTGGKWRRVIVPLDIIGNQSNLYVRFTLQSDAARQAGGWYLDDVAILQGSEISGVLAGGANTEVCLLGENFNNALQECTTSDANGNYAFGLLPLGNYQIVASGVTNALILNGPNLETNVTVSVMLPSVEFTLMNQPPIVVTWSASNSFIYALDFTTNLVSGVWSNLSVQTSVVDGTLSYTDTFPSVERVYRVSVTNSP